MHVPRAFSMDSLYSIFLYIFNKNYKNAQMIDFLANIKLNICHFRFKEQKR
jgi:hypothetical protein